ncbi:uncharacterized protein LOC143903554 isoform X2 [Temnothorax americanus]
MCTEVIWNFLFWYSEDLTVSSHVTWGKTLQGLMTGVQCFLGELPFNFVSGSVLKKLGHVNVMSLVLLIYAIRLLSSCQITIIIAIILFMISDGLRMITLITLKIDIGSTSDDSENVVIAEKSGDEFLIELYRERSFLYDKRNANFKNTLMKQNAWNEISKTMIETNCGDFYTPDYCQRRCTSLREQYNHEKKRLENQCRSGSGAPNLTSRQFPLYAQLKFLDQVIKRRKTYSNVTKCQPDATFVNKGPTGSKSHVPDDVNAFSSCNKESQNTKPKEIVDAEHTYGKGVICSPRPRKRKLDETKELEHNFFNMGNRIVNYMESTKASTADDAFMEFIKVQFNGMPEHEKHIRRKMMMDCLITPLPETSN